MRIYREVPTDGRAENLHPLLDLIYGFGCNSTTVFIAHGAEYFTTLSAINLPVRKASAPDHISLNRVDSPILNAQSCAVLLQELQFLQLEYFRNSRLCGRDDLCSRVGFDYTVYISH